MTYRPADPNDRRPLPPEIYMRRRVAALAALLVLVALLIWGLSAAARSGGGADQAAETSAATVTENITTEPTVTVAGETKATATGTEETKTEAESTEPTPAAESTEPNDPALATKKSCALEDLKITARTSAPSFAADDQPVFYMSVENPTAADCVIDLNAAQLRFEVYDMATNERIWSDTDCHPAVVTGTETFTPKKARDFEAVWSRKDSQPGRCSNRQEVPAGSYYLHAVIGQHASAPADFTLRP